MKKIRAMNMRLSILGLLLVFAAPASEAGNRSGTVSEQFLKLSTSARAVAIGGAQVALAEGASSIGFNPAGMMTVNNIGVGITYTSWLADIQHSYAGLVKNVPGVGAVGISITTLTTDDITETTEQFPEGWGQTFRASDLAVSLAYARQVTDQFRVGLNGKYIKSYLYNTELGTSTFALDIGTLYEIPILHSHVGVSLTNIGKDVKFINETYSLPTALRFGVAVDVMKEAQNQFISTLQIARLNDADEQYNFGAEYTYNNFFALRAGWKFAYDQENITAGFGVKLNSLGFDSMLDYGFNNFRYLPGTHTFTIEVQL